MNTTVIANLKRLYSTPSPRREIRSRTLAPLLDRARALRSELATIRDQYEDAAREATSLNLTALVRYLRPDLVPVIGRVVLAARELQDAGTAGELMASAYTAQDLLDAPEDRSWEAAMQLLKRDLERVEGSVAALRSNARVLDGGLDVLAAAVPLSNDTVTVPKLDNFFTSNQPAAPAAK